MGALLEDRAAAEGLELGFAVADASRVRRSSRPANSPTFVELEPGLIARISARHPRAMTPERDGRELVLGALDPRRDQDRDLRAHDDVAAGAACAGT